MNGARGRMERYSEYKLGTYLLCPRKFYYTYIDRQERTRPPLSQNQILGNNVHLACKEFYRLRAEDRTREHLHNLFRRLWKNNGAAQFFSSREEEREAGLSGLHMLDAFFTHFAETKPYLMEKYLENAFETYVLFGRVDRVDLEKDGSLTIIDYKTNPFYENEGRERERKTLQLKIYAVLLNSAERPVLRGTYFHMMENVFDDVEFTHKSIAYIKKSLDDIIDDIRADKLFSPTFGTHCKYCHFKGACENALPGRDGDALLPGIEEVKDPKPMLRDQ